MENLERQDKTGRTPWDLISENSKTTFAIILILLGIVLTLILTGILSYHDNKIHIAYNPAKSSLTESVDLVDMINEGKKLAKDYIIEDLFHNIQLEKNDSQQVAYVRTMYRIRALKTLTNLPFRESYSSSYAKKIEHVFGSDREFLQGSGRYYDINLNMKENEVKTILTGCNFYHDLPLKNDRNGVAGDILLQTNQEAEIYPNPEDLIAQLTIRVESNSLKIRQIQPGARRYQIKSSQKEDIPLQYDEAGVANTNNRSLTYTWRKVLPSERVAIYFRWD